MYACYVWIDKTDKQKKTSQKRKFVGVMFKQQLYGSGMSLIRGKKQEKHSKVLPFVSVYVVVVYNVREVFCNQKSDKG